MRRTITFDEDVVKEIQRRRAKLLFFDNKEVSFTAIVNELLRGALFPNNSSNSGSSGQK